MKSDDSKALPEFGHYADVNGLRMYYEDRGKGVPLILVHGGLLTGRLGWGDLRERFTQHFRVIVPDCRGCGRTDNPQNIMDYRVMADDVVALAKALELVNPFIGGWSDGGQVVLEIGIRYPDFAKALVVGAAQHKLSQKTKDGLALVPKWFESEPGSGIHTGLLHGVSRMGKREAGSRGDMSMRRAHRGRGVWRGNGRKKRLGS